MAASRTGSRPVTAIAAIAIAGLWLVTLAAAGWRPAARAGETADLTDPADAGIAALIAAYPDVIAGRDGNDLVMRDGTRMAIEDGRTGKSLDELLEKPDIAEQFHFPYPRGAAGVPPARDTDPGRIRYEPLFEKIYGSCEAGVVERHLVPVKWLPRHGGGRVMFTEVAGAAKALAAVSAELDALPDRFMRYLKPHRGSYNCRMIAGTRRHSMHAYGAAIDIQLYGYWRDVKPDKSGLYRYPVKDPLPQEIVDIFEKHGFIWGGKWYHFDTMHFEYRPELTGPS
ncbi:MAG: M15 family metallopeptidase [Hyphomicrobiaceae bacterium]